MNVIASTDLLYPGQPDPIGLPNTGNYGELGRLLAIDRTRYVVWVDTGRPARHAMHRPELAPRLALHLVACRNGAGP